MMVLGIHGPFADLISTKVFQNRRVNFDVMGRRFTDLRNANTDHTVTRMALFPSTSV